MTMQFIPIEGVDGDLECFWILKVLLRAALLLSSRFKIERPRETGGPTWTLDSGIWNPAAYTYSMSGSLENDSQLRTSTST